MPESVEVRIVLAAGAVVPRYQTAESAGVDLCTSEDFELEPLKRRLVGTGVSIALPVGFEAQVRPRSGLAIKQGVTLVNSPGTIDSDYRGEIKLIMINLGESGVKFKRGDRVGQLVICPVFRAVFQEVDALDESERGSGGFGSTG